jgi:hypothetical protein
MWQAPWNDASAEAATKNQDKDVRKSDDIKIEILPAP